MYKSFIIHQPTFSFSEKNLDIQCRYSFDDERNFVENFVIDFDSIAEIFIDEIPAYVEMLAIAASSSYFKASPTTQVVIDFPVSVEVNEWAYALLDEGLREFRFQNNLDLLRAPMIVSIDKERASSGNKKLDENLLLVPIGGGKDSATTIEILQKTDKKIVGFSIGKFASIDQTAKVASLEMVRVTRTLDPTLIDWNDQGALNGHVPVTAITSTLATLAAYCIGAGSVVMSNEASANEPTRVIDEIEVNHQYSKSFQAEKLLRNALNAHTKDTVDYFSLLRVLSEFQIFSIFSSAIRFHKTFTSCNRVFKIDKKERSKSWCGECDKCRFVFIGLSAFLNIEEVTKIFGKNLLKDETNTQGFLDLIGMGEGKPFECVGTIGETVLLMKKALNKVDLNEELKTTLDSIKDIEFLSQNEQLGEEFGVDNFVPTDLLNAIEELKIENYRNQVLKKLDRENIGVVGLGRDTAGIIRFLENVGYKNGISIYLPDDQNISDEDFLKANEELQINDVGFARKCIRNFEELSKCTLIFVSPGISKYSDLVVAFEEETTTPLAWWLSLNREILPEKIFIGITGTKGKSTTSSMLNHVLQDSVLVGNIGNSVGSLPLEELMNSRYVILEVSSFQASYVTTSPHIGVLTSLFDCHIDWHLNQENYFRDKQNLFEHGCEEIVMGESVLENDSDNITRTLHDQNTNIVLEVLQYAAPNLTIEEIAKSLVTFKGLKYRKELVSTKKGILYISDVLATAPHASVDAVKDIAKTYPDARVFLLYGGAYKNVDQSDVIADFKLLDKKHVVITLPETGHQIENQLDEFQHCNELVDGVKWANENAEPGDVILLAPGAPSFHRYQNYEKLHEHFIQLIENL